MKEAQPALDTIANSMTSLGETLRGQADAFSNCALTTVDEEAIRESLRLANEVMAPYRRGVQVDS